MSSPSQKPFAIDPGERRRLLSRHLVPVVERLAEAGEPYGDLSVERIIKAGNISRSAFYTYFDDKVDLLVAMAEDVVAGLVASGEAWWEFPHDGTKADLRVALRVPLDNYRDSHMILGAIVEVATYDERVRAQQRHLIEQVSAAMAAHLAEAQKVGAADASLDPVRSASWIVWMLERGLYQLVHPADETETELLLDAATDLIWNAFYATSRL